MRPPAVLIAGPTATGKSELALALADTCDGEIINADAIQLYRDLRLLSARPGAPDEARAPHHLYAVADAADAWSVGRWLRTASEIIDHVRGRGRIPIVVGGTGLYFRALTVGLAEMPESHADSRASAEAAFLALGEVAFRTRLRQIDPAAEARISRGDRQRLVRALEVHARSGKALSDLQAQTEPVLPSSDWIGVVVDLDRVALYERCDARLTRMVEAGALDEVGRLIARDLDPALPAMKATGLRELAAHLRGEVTLADAVALAQRETRRYAKRQSTWFRNQTTKWPRVDGADLDVAATSVLSLIAAHGFAAQ